MASGKHQQSVDEKVYKRTKGKTGVTVVYTSAAEKAAQKEQRKGKQAERIKQQDEAVADTFPASDAPAASVPTTATPSTDRQAESES